MHTRYPRGYYWPTGYSHRFLQELAPDIPVERLEFYHIHRSLSPKPSDDPPRDVIIKFHYYRTKEKLLQVARDQQNLSFQGNSLQLFADLSTVTIARQRGLKPYLQVLQTQGIKYRWGFPYLSPTWAVSSMLLPHLIWNVISKIWSWTSPHLQWTHRPPLPGQDPPGHLGNPLNILNPDPKRCGTYRLNVSISPTMVEGTLFTPMWNPISFATWPSATIKDFCLPVSLIPRTTGSILEHPPDLFAPCFVLGPLSWRYK